LDVSPHRGGAPLRDIVLAATGQDVRQCMHCLMCNRRPGKGMDLVIGEIMQAVVRDDVRVLKSRTLWGSEDYLMRDPRCQAGLEISSVILALQREAQLRGLSTTGVSSAAELE
jgi:hypothetical protein